MTTATTTTNHCPSCKGTGKTTVTVHEGGKSSAFSMKCYYCEGNPLTEKEGKRVARMIAKEESMWCKCETRGDVTYHDDTKKMKHHWTCNCCKKIVQIG